MWDCFSRCMINFLTVSFGFAGAFFIMAIVALAFAGSLTPITLLAVAGVAVLAFFAYILLSSAICFAECSSRNQQANNAVDNRPVVATIIGMTVYGITWVYYLHPLLKIG